MAWTTPRTWVTSEIVTAAMMNTHVRDNMNVGRGRDESTRNAGNYTLNATAWTNLDTNLDLVLPAATNDYVTVSLSAQWGNEGIEGYLDVSCVASGNTFGQSGATQQGISGWMGAANTFMSVGATISRRLVSGDISGGNVQLRLRYRVNVGFNKTLFGNANLELNFFAQNVGPAV